MSHFAIDYISLNNGDRINKYQEMNFLDSSNTILELKPSKFSSQRILMAVQHSLSFP